MTGGCITKNPGDFSEGILAQMWNKVRSPSPVRSCSVAPSPCWPKYRDWSSAGGAVQAEKRLQLQKNPTSAQSLAKNTP